MQRNIKNTIEYCQKIGRPLNLAEFVNSNPPIILKIKRNKLRHVQVWYSHTMTIKGEVERELTD